MENSQIIALWQEVFPKSMMVVRRACLGDSFFFTGKLAKDRSESTNGILENDPLNYGFCIDGSIYKEHSNSLYIKPDPIKEKYLCYGCSRLRRKTIKDVTPDKLLKRFNQIKQHVIDNKDNFKDLLFKIEDKI